MAAVANQVHGKAQQSGARSRWNPIDAATLPPMGTRERFPNLSDPRTDHATRATIVEHVCGFLHYLRWVKVASAGQTIPTRQGRFEFAQEALSLGSGYLT
jgi:hypothetical protein